MKRRNSDIFRRHQNYSTLQSPRLLWQWPDGDKAQRVHVGRDLDLRARVVLPVLFHFVRLQRAADQQHGEIRRVGRVVGQAEFEAFELVPSQLAGCLAQLQRSGLGRLGLVHGADLEATQRL